jgi:hypothetical protein
MALLGQGRVVPNIASTKVTGGLSLVAKVGLDYLLVGGVPGGDIQEFKHHVWGLATKC